MSTRISSALLPAGVLLAGLLLPGCDRKAQTRAEAVAIKKGEEARAAAEGRIPCSLSPKGAFDLTCTFERQQTQDGLVLTIRHPDGGFRRLRVTGDGRGVIAADGAKPATVSIIDKDSIEVDIADVRYRLPARVRGAR